MTIIRKQLFLLGMLLVGVIVHGSAQENARPTNAENGTLIVLVTWGDVSNTPANDVYVEAHTSSAKPPAPASYVLTQVHAGRYESALPPGVYDVFISEGGSVPRCRRVQIRSKFQSYWTVKLEIDDVYPTTN